MKTLDYALLREIQKKETGSTKIVSLEEGFYTNASEFLKKRKEEAFASGSTLSIREYENIKKIIDTIKERREEKIVLMSIRGDATQSGLTPEERELLGEFSGAVKKFREKVSELLSSGENRTSAPERKKVKLLKDIEPYKGIDSRIYGPFKKDDKTELPAGEAEWLLKAKMAEIV